MGVNITNGEFKTGDLAASEYALQSNLRTLAGLLNNPEFGHLRAGRPALGAELEMYIVDGDGQPLGINEALVADADDPLLSLELNRYNLEYNLRPYSFSEAAFEATERDMLQQLARLNQLAEQRGGQVLPIGILPTLKPSHFGPSMLTPQQRYVSLVKQLSRNRGEQFRIHIDGQQPLRVAMPDVTLEGANTSFQIHYRVEPQRFADTFNAFQLVTPLVVAVAANSPGLFEHDLWHETRIPLFKQSIDARVKGRYSWQEPARVNFGHGWLRDSALELFQEIVNLYPPLLPLCQDGASACNDDGVPLLSELRLHQSTVWWWNRPVYDDADGGHLRIELRSLPAGPTPVDMSANAAFYIGLAEYYREEMSKLMPALPFHLAEYNFYRAAQSGLDATLVWPDSNQSRCRQYPIATLLEQQLPRAREGLAKLGISREEADKYLSVIEARVAKRQSGASWQKAGLKYLLHRHDSSTAHRMMLQRYMEHSANNTPVSEWPQWQ